LRGRTVLRQLGAAWKQFIASGASWAMAIAGTFVILKVISVFTKLCATDEEQDTGLDFSQHGEGAYTDFAMASPFGTTEASVLKTTNEVKPAL
jgi:Amt family ammonium transporter